MSKASFLEAQVIDTKSKNQKDNNELLKELLARKEKMKQMRMLFGKDEDLFKRVMKVCYVMS